MDCARWWNTQGILGRYGSLALGRGFPRTHLFAQAKIAFAVAAQRCKEIYSHPSAYTLWALPPEVEDQFQEKWLEWLYEAEKWEPTFKSLEDIAGLGLLELLSKQRLITSEQVENAKKLRRSAEGRSVPISNPGPLNDNSLTMLAAGFFRGEPSKPAIPYLPFGTTS
jgi:hypothetical protein